MSLPPYFEKKAKTGPCRVCGECRFKILGGAKLVERLSTDLPELDNVTRGSIKGSLNASITCTAPGCTSARVSKNGYCAVHVNEFGAGGAELATSASIAVRWEGGASVLTKVAVTDKSMNLLQVDMAFRKQCPDFARRGDDFEYLYKGEGIAEVFYDLFTVQHFVPFGSQVMIRKRVDTDLLVAQYARQNVAGRATAALNNTRGSFHTAAAANQVDAATAASSQPTARINPFARKPGSSDSDAPGMFSRKAPVVKAEPVKKVFRKPGSGGQIPSKFALANANGAGGAASIKKGPPSLPGAGGASSSGGPPPPPGAKAGPPALPSAAVTDLKVRAQKYFGSY
jgi:hypothetical protein